MIKDSVLCRMHLIKPNFQVVPVAPHDLASKASGDDVGFDQVSAGALISPTNRCCLHRSPAVSCALAAFQRNRPARE